MLGILQEDVLLKHFRIYKLFTALFIVVLVLTSNYTIGNFVTASANFADSASDSDTLGVDGYSISWDSNSQGNFADSETSVELVIGVDSKPNGFAGLSRIISQNGGEVVETISIGESQAIVANLPIEVASTFSSQVRASGLSRYVEVNGQCTVDTLHNPNDEYWSEQWGPKMIEADHAWNTTIGNNTVLVAIIDTGIDYTHPDLVANYVALGYDFVNNDNDPLDDYGHGTHCAGIVAATMNNSRGIAGIAQVRIMAEKGLDDTGHGSFTDLAQCIIHATDAGANILSNSWGASYDSSLIHDAIDYATAHGVLVLASSGNHAADEYYFDLNYPAAYDNVVSVASTNSSDQLSYFSNYGDYVDVSAPGSLIYSTMPTYPVTMNIANNASIGYSMNYSNMSGTSMACPHAAGVAALIWSQYPVMTADLVRYQLESTCDDLGDEGFDIYYGAGRINAKNAVETILPDDILVTQWNTQNLYLKNNKPADFNATIFNRGLTNETDIQVQLLVNGSLVNSTTLAPIQPGAYAYPLLSWTPTSIGTYNITFYAVPQPGETVTENNAITGKSIVGTSPSETNWTLIATDPDENDEGMNLKAVSSQLQSDVVYFKVEFYRSWIIASEDIDTAILVDVDRNSRTGLPDHYFNNQNTGIGADRLIIVGSEGPGMWSWNATNKFFDSFNPVDFAYLDLPDNSSEFIVGIKTADLETNGLFDFAVSDAYSNWDWIPNSGYRPFIQDNVGHELAVTFVSSTSIQPGEPVVLNATVFNFGASNEADVSLQIQINGDIVINGAADQLSNGTCYSLAYTWTPHIEAIYNITVYAQPVAGETSIVNNVKTALVSVYPKIALITDFFQELDGITPILDSMWINYDIYNLNIIGLFTEKFALLNSYKAVILYNEGRNIGPDEQSALNSYLAVGGNLIVTGWDSLIDPEYLGLADVVRATTEGDNLDQPNLIVVNASHPIMNGPYGQFNAGYNITGLFSDNDAVKANTAQNAITIAELADGKDKIIATDSLPGKVVYWNGDGARDWVDNASCTAMLKNTLIWFLDTSPPVTTDDYNGSWYNANYTITLEANGYFGVNQTYYKINDGLTRSVAADGQPMIAEENANNTLEYWSVNLAGIEETHHFITQIKLDTANPTGSLQINNGDTYTNSNTVTLTLTATDSISGVNQVKYSNDGVWDTETWETLTSTKAWTLPSGDGAKTVYCQIQNNAGLNTTVSASTTLYTLQVSQTPTLTPTATPSPSPSPTATPTATIYPYDFIGPLPSGATRAPAPTTSPTTTTSPTQTSTPNPSSMSLTVPVIGAIMLIGLILIGLLVKRKKNQTPQVLS
jgi:thermitase